jgi:hypothetical protein
MAHYRATFDRARLLPLVRVVAGLLVLSLVGSLAWSLVRGSSGPSQTATVVGVAVLPDGTWLVSFVAVADPGSDWRVEVRRRSTGGVDLVARDWGAPGETDAGCGSQQPWSLPVTAPEDGGPVFDAVSGAEVPLTRALSGAVPNPPVCLR